MGTDQTEIIFVVLLAGAALFFANVLKRKPKEKHFKCGRCAKTTLHSARTIEAWRNGKTRFFCQNCHAEWLRDNPKLAKAGNGSNRAGCLGVIAVVVAAPTVAFIVVRAYA